MKGKDIRILIAEDNEGLRKLVAGFLLSYYDVVEASNGKMATDIIEDTAIDMIISDIMMPLKDGVSLCREVKTSIATSHIPFIMFTAKSRHESEMEVVEAGADAYLEKPVDFDMLLQVIKNIFNRQEKIREYYAKQYFVGLKEISVNRQDHVFLQKFYDLLEANIDNPVFNVDYIASELMMSRSKFYTKLKTITGKTFVEIVMNYRLKKAVRLMIEENLTVSEIIMQVGIESQSYFCRTFKKEFGETPTAFAKKHRLF